MLKRFLSLLMRTGANIQTRSLQAWKWFRSRKLWQQVAIAAAFVALCIGGVVLANSGPVPSEAGQQRTVAVQSIASIAGGGDSVSVVGSVRSVAEAQMLAQAGGTVRAVHTQIGSAVPAGFVIAELDNATERAQVLQAQGAYEAALAARSAVSPTDVTATVRNTYRTAFATIDTTIHTDLSLFFGNETAFGPQFLLNQGRISIEQLSRRRANLDQLLASRRASLPNVNSRDPEILLAESDGDLRTIGSLIDDIAETAARRDSNASATQIAALTDARTSINAELAAVSAAREAYRSKSTTSTASVDAGAKSALGTLRLAQATLEKTIIRAPIGGTVNFLPIRVGDYVTAYTHVATVAQNGALEIVTYVSEEDRQNLSAGMKVRIDDKYDGVITVIAPALDPNTKQIEVHVAVSGGADLANGKSVRIAFSSAAISPTKPAATGPLLLPLAALKLTPSARVVFSVADNGRLVAHAVEIGDVRGDRIEVLTTLPTDLQIVTDARGLSEGQQVKVGVTP